jgi:hypothetical protein
MKGFCDKHGGHSVEEDSISLLPKYLAQSSAVFVKMILEIIIEILCGLNDFHLVLFEFKNVKVFFT